MAPRENFVWSTDIDISSLSDPMEQIKASVFEGKLSVDINGNKQDVELPSDAFTDDITAKVEGSQLTITIARRDPEGPAMQEKRLLNPDRHPVDIAITLPKDLIAKSAKVKSPTEQLGGTPAQQTVTEVNPALYGEPETRYKMPEVNMGSSIVTAMPVMDNAGGAVDTVSKGETVVAVPGMLGNKHLTGVTSESGSTPSADDLADKMRDTVVRDQAPKGATVLFGQKEKQNEAKYDDSAATPHMGTAAGGQGGEAAGSGVGVTGYGAEAKGAPAGDEEHMRATGARGDKIKADFTQNKVGMEYEELTAADRYVTAESADNEPISSMKQPGAKCDLCACNPCQCGKMRKTGGTGNDPYELSYPEQKRGGKPAIHSKHREETGRNAHDARDYRAHASQVDATHVGIGAKLSEYQGNVPDGQGDWSDPQYAERLKGHGVHGATHTGGAPIEMGGPGRRHVSDAAKGGPIKGGSKTTFTTMG